MLKNSTGFQSAYGATLSCLGAHALLGTTPVQQSIKVEQLFAHEDFSMAHLKNDIALLKLKTPVMLSDKVNTVCLPEQGSRVGDGKICYITGTVWSIGYVCFACLIYLFCVIY